MPVLWRQRGFSATFYQRREKIHQLSFEWATFSLGTSNARDTFETISTSEESDMENNTLMRQDRPSDKYRFQKHSLLLTWGTGEDFIEQVLNLSF
jgi:hypothetical protein